MWFLGRRQPVDDHNLHLSWSWLLLLLALFLALLGVMSPPRDAQGKLLLLLPDVKLLRITTGR